MKEVTINGKTVKLHSGPFPAARFHAAFTAIMTDELKTGEFERDTWPLTVFVEGWEFGGDPADVAAWSNLDYIREYGPLRNAILDIVNAEFEAREGN